MTLARSYGVVATALRGPRAISLRGCLILATTAVVGAFAVDSVLGRGFALSIWMAFSMALASGLVLLVGRLTVLRRAPREEANPVVTLTVFVAAGAVRPVVATGIGMWAGQQVPLDGQRFVTAILASVISLTVVAVALDTNDRHKQTIRELDAELQELDHQRLTSQATVSRIAAAIDATMVTRLRSGIDDTRHALDALDPSSPAIGMGLRRGADTLAELNESYVRPMSHALYRNEPMTEAESMPARDDSPRAHRSHSRERIVNIFTLAPFHPVATPIILAAGSLFIAISSLGVLRGTLTVLLQCAVLGICLAVSERVLSFQRRQRLSDVRRALAVLVLVLLSIALTFNVAAAVAAAFGSFDPVAGASGITWTLLVWALLAWLSSSYIARARTVGVLRATRSTRLWELDALNLELKDLRAQRASYLHGKIQSRLTMIALYLRRTADQVDADPGAVAVVEDAVEMVRAELQSLVSGLDALSEQAGPTIDVSRSLESIREAWLGIVDVSYTGEAVMVASAGSSRAVVTNLIEVVAEAVTNAAKHGNARSIAISFARDGEAIRLRAHDDGRGLKSTTRPPDSIARILGDLGSCTISNAPTGGTLLEVRIPTSR